jgi:hypothetical protein
MTPEKLRFIATYVSECDSIVGELLRRARQSYLRGDRGAVNVSDEALEFVNGKEVQADLHKWADELEATQGT